MAASLLSLLGPTIINGTTIPAMNRRLVPNINELDQRHSGGRFASNKVRKSIQPAILLTVPVLAAYNLVGLKFLKLTSLTASLSALTDFERDATANVLWTLTASATGIVTIGSLTEVEGIVMAQVTIALGSSTGQADPLTRATGALPALPAAPTLHTRGPCELNGARISGVTSFAADTGNRIIIPGDGSLDGDTYPRTFAYDGGDRRITLGHSSPRSLFPVTGQGGATISGTTKVYLRQVGSDYLTTGANGFSLAVGAGSIVPTDLSDEAGKTSEMGVEIRGLSSDSETDPWVVSTNAVLPAA